MRTSEEAARLKALLTRIMLLKRRLERGQGQAPALVRIPGAYFSVFRDDDGRVFNLPYVFWDDAHVQVETEPVEGCGFYIRG